jgi:hypothetical protein
MSIRTKVNAFRYLLETWVTAMPGILYYSTLALLFDPKGSQVFIHQVLNAQHLESDDPVLGSVVITDLLGESKLGVENYSKRSSATRLLIELASLAYIMRVLRPQLIFEIGTFVGRTTRLLALNAPPTSQILTLDLYPEQVKHKIGEAFHGTAESEHITQLHGNSQSFNF